MKKMIFALAVFAYCLLVAVTSKAQPGLSVPDAVKKSFSTHFKNSQCSRWTKVQEAYVATFTEGIDWKDAYFTDDGELKGVGKYITGDRLPMFVEQKINEYSNYELLELYQYECMENGLCFFAVLKNNKHQIALRMSPYGDVTYSRKIRIKQNKTASSDIALNKKNNQE
ncbi:MAG TPA: hypothetical protein VGQ09_13260 [Chitinophagaceae bacterium]|jgi:hypothetical protein|nr:hypothetical protein [Chitinophagaceae bacterium]